MTCVDDEEENDSKLEDIVTTRNRIPFASMKLSSRLRTRSQRSDVSLWILSRGWGEGERFRFTGGVVGDADGESDTAGDAARHGRVVSDKWSSEGGRSSRKSEP